LITAGSISLVVAIGSATAGAGTASAGQLPGRQLLAGQVTVLTSCTATVPDAVNQTVAITPTSVLTQITAALAPLDPLNVIRPEFLGTWRALPPIPVGSTFGTGQPSMISGREIAGAVTSRLAGIPVLSPVLEALVPQVSILLSATCGVLVRTVSGLFPVPVKDRPPVPAPPTGPTPASTTTTTPSTTTTNAPAAGGASASAGGVPAAPGIPMTGFFDLGSGLPSDGVAYNNAAPPLPIDLNALRLEQQQQRMAGHAEPLAQANQTVVSRAILFAVLLLALVAGQLARTWVLRRGRPSTGRPADEAIQDS
jgi:hypothetical protein